MSTKESDLFADLFEPEPEEEEGQDVEKEVVSTGAVPTGAPTQAEAVAAPAIIRKADKPLTHSRIIFDIETGPEDEDKLRQLFSFDATKIKGYELLGKTFDPTTVRLGNIKDPAKRSAKIESVREAFESAQQAAEAGEEAARGEQWQEFVSRAALSPLTGQILAIGYADEGDSDDYGMLISTGGTPENYPPEQMLLEIFWATFAEVVRRDGQLIGFNSHAFDLPFIVRRSWLLGIEVPGEVMRDGRYWHRCCVDLMQVWQCGGRGDWVPLGSLATYFSCESRKIGNGAEFAGLYNAPETREQALDYLRNDLRMTVEVAMRMGVL